MGTRIRILLGANPHFSVKIARRPEWKCPTTEILLTFGAFERLSFAYKSINTIWYEYTSGRNDRLTNQIAEWHVSQRRVLWSALTSTEKRMKWIQDSKKRHIAHLLDVYRYVLDFILLSCAFLALRGRSSMTGEFSFPVLLTVDFREIDEWMPTFPFSDYHRAWLLRSALSWKQLIDLEKIDVANFHRRLQPTATCSDPIRGLLPRTRDTSISMNGT